MPFVWNFENLKAEIDAINPTDPVAEFEIMAAVDTIDKSKQVGRISSGEAQCLILMVCALQAQQRRGE